jgi:hypothetical protein
MPDTYNFTGDGVTVPWFGWCDLHRHYHRNYAFTRYYNSPLRK